LAAIAHRLQKRRRLQQEVRVKILVFGAGGQVGSEVRRAAWPSRYVVLPLDRKAVDITKDAAVAEVLRRERPDLVINLAAYTAVDRAESEPEAAWAANCAGAAHLAAACDETAASLVHLSTDYVFNGRKAGPYQEEDAVDPLGVYGRSKEAGERAVRAALARHVILRTAWVFGASGANFVKTMLRLAGERRVLRVVADQRGCPTAAADIAAALIAISGSVERGEAKWGTFHFASDAPISWHGFAEAIFALAGPRLASHPNVEPIATDQYPTPAQRPMNSVLDCRRIEEAFGISRPHWPAGLDAVIAELLDRPPP
jgi:dTDP-4-dehydrorhamnose reductase